MRKITNAIAMASLVVAAAAGSAPAFATVPQAPAGSQGIQADGFLYAWEHPHGGGFMCRWERNSDDWEVCYDDQGNYHNMQNQASDLWNNGIASKYDNVYLFYNERRQGAYACLGRGDSWPDLIAGGQTFDHGLWWADGHGQRVENNIASHAWTSNDC